ncbi:MAG: MFS transporter, DHA1 family, multidrug resistance protein [Rugosibacter sp.]|nr:MFS transporter, DHA1 family, multidrug resistance protein [Rugosibacter sp.]
MKISQQNFAFLLAALSAIGPFAIDTYLPAFPAMAQDLGATPLQVQQTLTFYLLPFGFMMLWHGTLSDAWGRRRIILAGLFLFMLSSLLCAVAPRIEVLWLGRALQGMSSGVGMVVGRAMVRDVLQGAYAQRLMAKVAILFALAPAVSPIIGGYLLQIFDWRGIFIFLALFAGLILAACWAWLPETLAVEKRQSLHPWHLLRAYQDMLGHGLFNRLALAGALSFNAFFIYIVAAPVFLIRHLALTPQSFAVMFVPQVLGMMAGSFLSGRLAGKLSHRRTIMLSFAVMALASGANVVISLTLPPGLPWSILPLPVFACGMSLSMPNIQLMALELFPARRGLASSTMSAMSTLVSALSTALLVPLLWDSTLSLAAGMAVFLALGWLVFVSTRTDDGKASVA